MGKKTPTKLPLPLNCDNFFRDILENCNDLVLSISPEGKILYANRAWRELLGYSEDDLSNMSIMDIIPQDCLGECMKKFESILKGEDIGKIETVFLKKNGEKVLVEGSCNCMFEDARPLYVRSIFRDITERKEMEARLLQAQNLEAIGLLAGGIAHDFNNLLTCIMGLLSVAKLYASQSEPVCEILKRCEDTCLQGKALTSKFLTFASGGEPVRKRTPTVAYFKSTIDKLSKKLGILPRYELSDELWDIDIDKDQFEVVLENILLNTKEAVESSDSPSAPIVVLVTGENVSMPINGNNEGAIDDFVKISIVDNGPGIHPSELSKIFEPYYSTKKKSNEKGIGFGLTIAYSVMKRHHGLITAQSELGKGTTINLFIPRAKECTLRCN